MTTIFTKIMPLFFASYLLTTSAMLTANKPYETGNQTWLHYFANRGNTQKLAELLLDPNNLLLIDTPDISGWTPLHFAADCGHLECIKLLVHYKARINVTNDLGRTPLYLTIANRHWACVEELIQQGARVDTSFLHAFAGAGIIKCLQMILTQKDVNVNAVNDGGQTPLHYAANAGNVECIRALLQKSAKVNAKDHEGKTPLHRAVNTGHYECVLALLQNKALVDVKDNNGQTPLHSAIISNYYYRCDSLTNCVDTLLFYGADIDEKDKKGWTPLHHAAFHDNHTAKVLLVRKGASTLIKNNDGKTPIDLEQKKDISDHDKVFYKGGYLASLVESKHDSFIKPAKK